jgi:hypothetical protein
MRQRVVALCLVIAVTGCSSPVGAPQSPGTSTSVSANSPSPAASPLIVVPDVVGLNAAVALDRLHRLGFKNVDLGTVDGHEFVILPQNWTVRTQSARPGDQITSDTKIVLGCARNG